MLKISELVIITLFILANVIMLIIFAIVMTMGMNNLVFIQSTFKFCTMEAKLCPDGSSVGRIPPNCEFAACPSDLSTKASATDDWQTYRNEKYHYEIQFPKILKLFGSKSGLNDEYNPRYPVESQDSIVFAKNGFHIMLMYLEAFVGTKWLEDWKAKGYTPPLYIDETDGELSESFLATTTFKGYPAIRTERCDMGGCTEDITLIKDGITYRLISKPVVLEEEGSAGLSVSSTDIELFNQILSTFKFIPQ